MIHSKFQAFKAAPGPLNTTYKSLHHPAGALQQLSAGSQIYTALQETYEQILITGLQTWAWDNHYGLCSLLMLHRCDS